MRVMIDRKNLHMIYEMSFLNDDFIMLIYILSFRLQSPLCNDFINIDVAIDYVVSNGLIFVLLYYA